MFFVKSEYGKWINLANHNIQIYKEYDTEWHHVATWDNDYKYTIFSSRELHECEQLVRHIFQCLKEGQQGEYVPFEGTM